MLTFIDPFRVNEVVLEYPDLRFSSCPRRRSSSPSSALALSPPFPPCAITLPKKRAKTLGVHSHVPFRPLPHLCLRTVPNLIRVFQKPNSLRIMIDTIIITITITIITESGEMRMRYHEFSGLPIFPEKFYQDIRKFLEVVAVIVETLGSVIKYIVIMTSVCIRLL